MEGGTLIHKNVHPNIYLSNENDNEKGGKLLASGSSSCVFRPFIPCKGSSDKQTNDKISKIIYGSKSEIYLNQEKTMNNIIKQIKGYKSWCLIYDKFCKAPNYSNIFKNYDKDIINCLDEMYSKKFNNTNNMMIGDYGGKTFEDCFLDRILKYNKNIKILDKDMYILF